VHLFLVVITEGRKKCIVGKEGSEISVFSSMGRFIDGDSSSLIDRYVDIIVDFREDRKTHIAAF